MSLFYTISDADPIMSFYNGYNSHGSQLSSSQSSPSRTPRHIHAQDQAPNSTRRTHLYPDTQGTLTSRRRFDSYNSHLPSLVTSSSLHNTKEVPSRTDESTYTTSLKFPPHDAKDSFAEDGFETSSHYSKPYFSSRRNLSPVNSRHSSSFHPSNIEKIILNDHSHHSHTHVDTYTRDEAGRLVISTPCLSPQASKAFDTLIAALKERGNGNIVSASALLLRDFLSYDKRQTGWLPRTRLRTTLDDHLVYSLSNAAFNALIHHLSILCGSGTLDEVNYVILVALAASSLSFDAPSTCLDISRGLDLLSRFEPDIFRLYDTSLGSKCVLSPQTTVLTEPNIRISGAHLRLPSSVSLHTADNVGNADIARSELETIRQTFPFSSFMARLRFTFFTLLAASSSDKLRGLLSFLREADPLRSGKIPFSRFLKALSAYVGAAGGSSKVSTSTLFSRPNVLAVRLYYGKDSAFLLSASGYVSDSVNVDLPFLSSLSKARLVHDALKNLYSSITAHFSRLVVQHTSISKHSAHHPQRRFVPFRMPTERDYPFSTTIRTSNGVVSNNSQDIGFSSTPDIFPEIAPEENPSLSSIAQDDFVSLILQYSHVIPDSVYFDCAVQDSSEIEYIRFLDDLFDLTIDSVPQSKHLHYDMQTQRRRESGEEYFNESLKEDLSHYHIPSTLVPPILSPFNSDKLYILGYSSQKQREGKEEFLSQTLQYISDMFTSSDGNLHPRSHTAQHGVVYGDPAYPSAEKLHDILSFPAIRDRLHQAHSYVLQSILSGSVARSFQFQPSDFARGDPLHHGLVRSSFFQYTLQRLLGDTISTACVIITTYLYACFDRRDVALDCFSKMPWEIDEEYPKGPYLGHWVDYEAFLLDMYQFRNLQKRKENDSTLTNSVYSFPSQTNEISNTSRSQLISILPSRQVTQNDIRNILRTLSSDFLSSHTTISYLESLLRQSDTLHQHVIPFSRLQHIIESCLPPPVSLVYQRNGSWDMVRTWYAIPAQHPGLDIGATLVDYPTFIDDLGLAQSMT